MPCGLTHHKLNVVLDVEQKGSNYMFKQSEIMQPVNINQWYKFCS